MNKTLKNVQKKCDSNDDVQVLDQEDIDNFMCQDTDDDDDDESEIDEQSHISNHLRTPDNEILFLVQKSWMNYATTYQKCGKRSLKNYMTVNNLVNVYGKSADKQHQQAIREKEDAVKKKRVNDVKSYLNRKQKRITGRKQIDKIKINGHKLTAQGTLYDITTQEGTSKKILHRTLMLTAPVELADYQEKIDGLRNKIGVSTRTPTIDETTLPIPTMEEERSDEMKFQELNDNVEKQTENVNVETKDSDSEDEIFVRSILKHKTEGGKLKFLLKFNDGTTDFATENEAKIDCPKLLQKYRKENMETVNIRKRKRVVSAVKQTRYRCKMIHTKFESFVDEGNEEYFRKGQPLWNVTCRTCNLIISNEDGENNFKPTLKCPAYVCRERTKGCRETICFECAKKLMLGSNNTVRATRRRK